MPTFHDFLDQIKQAGIQVCGEPVLIDKASAEVDWPAHVSMLARSGRKDGVVFERVTAQTPSNEQLASILSGYAFTPEDMNAVIANAMLSDIDATLRVRMSAAIWGTCYPADREFHTEWESVDGGLLKLIDAAESGAYSFQVEGLLVRHLLWLPPMPNFLGMSLGDDGCARHTIKRADWLPGLAREVQWETLRADLYTHFYDGGKGFYAHDLRFADLAIDWLKEGKPCVAGACSKLPN